MLRKFTPVVGLALLVLSIFAELAYGRDVSVRGYTRKDGTYVRPHHRSAPDGNFSNNWSTRGNVNPYTREIGTLTSPNTHSGYTYVPVNTGSSVPQAESVSPRGVVPKNAKLTLTGTGWICERQIELLRR
jgi:hypothetical protein